QHPRALLAEPGRTPRLNHRLGLLLEQAFGGEHFHERVAQLLRRRIGRGNLHVLPRASLIFAVQAELLEADLAGPHLHQDQVAVRNLTGPAYAELAVARSLDGQRQVERTDPAVEQELFLFHTFIFFLYGCDPQRGRVGLAGRVVTARLLFLGELRVVLRLDFDVLPEQPM